eukprot:236482-Prymnesium_polylepis.1
MQPSAEDATTPPNRALGTATQHTRDRSRGTPLTQRTATPRSAPGVRTPRMAAAVLSGRARAPRSCRTCRGACPCASCSCRPWPSPQRSRRRPTV